MDAPLPTPAEMAAWDAASVRDFGIRYEMLMENAARAALEVLQQRCGTLKGRRVLLLAGKGNNGGDAICLGRHLHDLGAQVLVLLAAPQGAYQGVSRYHLRLAKRTGTPLERLDRRPPALWGAPEILVDGLLGTGFSGELRPPYRDWVEALNARREQSFILALDIPSGLDGLTGRPCPIAVRAHATVTFEAAKLGLALPQAAAWTGELHVRPIGIPALVRERHPASCGLLTREVMDLFPRPSALMHKGTGGRLCLVGGSPGLTGAVCLAALGALRGGAGLVTAACPAGLRLEIKHGLPELMTLPLSVGAAPDGGTGEHWQPELLPLLDPIPARWDALVVGPGWGRGPLMSDCLERLLRMERPPTVLDADALHALAQRPELLRLLDERDVLTPHPGEMARLLGTDIPTVEAARLEAAQDFAQRHGVTVALKGPGTIIAAPGQRPRLAPFATACLAIGGSGDVLAGLVGNLLARGLSPLQATCVGVYWHGFTGHSLEKDFPLRGNLASEIARALPTALKELLIC